MNESSNYPDMRIFLPCSRIRRIFWHIKIGAQEILEAFIDLLLIDETILSIAAIEAEDKYALVHKTDIDLSQF